VSVALAAPAPTRRTQAERTAGSRRALLDATIACVVELGYARTTTTEVCKRAGLSQGSLFRHFPTKGALLAAAVEDLFPRILDGFETSPLPSGRARLAAAIDRLWDAFERPELRAAVELYVAARTDPELAAALAAVEPAHRARLHALAARLFPDQADNPRFAAAIDVAVDAVQGASMGRLLVLDSGGRAIRDDMRDVLVALLEGSSGER
jgi:AcrR family transcriptional regulator